MGKRGSQFEGLFRVRCAALHSYSGPHAGSGVGGGASRAKRALSQGRGARGWVIRAHRRRGQVLELG